jgi:hypothetical protein
MLDDRGRLLAVCIGTGVEVRPPVPPAAEAAGMAHHPAG